MRNRINLDKLELVEKIDKTRINILTRDEFIRFLDEETETWLYFFVRVCVCVYFLEYMNALATRKEKINKN